MRRTVPNWRPCQTTKNPREDHKAIILVPIAVFAVIGTILLLGYFMTILLRIPFQLGLSPSIRLFGAALLAIAMVLWIWPSDAEDLQTC